ncbi:MAG TPA: PilZ domain-containing protein [Terriglobia bacterium]|nr:PilZ domain-containing protein [Terriglobia bacterium]
MRVDRRRSDRVALTYPVNVRRRDEQGEVQEFEARTVSINRHGAHLEASQSLPVDQVLRLVNPLNHEEASFRVAGAVAAPADGGGVYSLLGPLSAETPQRREFGAESVDARTNFWGLYFPPLPANDLAEWTVMLECQSCRGVQSLPLAIAEADALEGSRAVSWPCDTCRAITSWGHPGKARQAAPGSNGHSVVAAARDDATRQEQRGSLHLPVLIRRLDDEVEQTQSVDSSRGGFSFSSEKDYEIGEEVMVACPYTPGAPAMEVRAQIARQQDVKGSNRRIFGVRYTSQEIPQASLASIGS